MYFQNKLKTRVYKPSDKSITSMPLEDIGILFRSLVKEAKEEYETKKLLIKERLELEHLRKYNATHENSYEGDFEFLDSEVAAELGPFRTLGSNQIKEFEEAVYDLAKKFNFSKKAQEWVFPQMQAYLVETLKVPSSGEISCSEIYNKVWNNNRLLAIVEIFKLSNRGPLLGPMTSSDSLDYNKLVPLVFAAYKRYAGVDYSRWTREDCYFLVEAKLADAITTEVDPEDFPAEDILAARDDALTVKTGDKAGSKRSAITTYMLYPSGGSILYGVNNLLQHIICQTWCAHPSNRSKYAILDTSSWDNTNIAPLVSTGVLKPKVEVELDNTNPFD